MPKMKNYKNWSNKANIKLRYLKRIKKTKFFPLKSCSKTRLVKQKKVLKYFRNSLGRRNILKSLYDDILKFHSIKQKKKYFLKNDKKTIYLIKPQFKINILLYFLNFFSSSHETKEFIKKEKIYINNKKIKGKYFLSCNVEDIVNIGKNIYIKQNFFKKNNKKKNFYSYISTFTEIDYFSNNLIILQKLKDFNVEDLNWNHKKYIEIRSLEYTHLNSL
jgi:hypothetical protein